MTIPLSENCEHCPWLLRLLCSKDGPHARASLENYYQGSLPQHKADISLLPLWEAAVDGNTGAADGLVQRLPLISGAEYEANSLQSLNDHPRWDDGAPADVA